MINQKKSKIFLWIGILLGITSSILYFIFRLRDNKKDLGSAFISKYINIHQDNTPEEKIKQENKVILSKEIRKDNLKTINGIGPAIELLLNKNGIFTFDDLRAMGIEDLKKILLTKNFRLADPSTWVEQAIQLSKK
jgi:predicted flap endonuclease-1-like 5' DNA nuclease